MNLFKKENVAPPEPQSITIRWDGDDGSPPVEFHSKRKVRVYGGQAGSNQVLSMFVLELLERVEALEKKLEEK